MDKAQEQVLTAAVQVAGGVMSMRKFIVTIAAVLLANPIIISEASIMDAFFYPEGSFIWVVLIAIMAGVIINIGWYGEFKRKNAPAENFSGKYVGSMILNMVATPVVSLLIIGWFAQMYCPQISLITYVLFMVIIEMVVCLGVLYLLNYGVKGFVAAFVKTAGEVQEAQQEVQQAAVNLNQNLKH